MTQPETTPTTTPVGRRRLLRWGGELAFLLVVVGAVTAWQNRGLPEGVPPPLDLVTVDGAPLSLATLKGTPTVIVFWAPWCGVCGAESDNLARAQRIVGDSGRVVTVAAEYEHRSDVDRYIDAHHLEAPVGLGGRTTARAWGVSAFPTAFFLSADGTISHRAVGYTSTLGLVIRLLLA